jgi:hypothetical protein
MLPVPAMSKPVLSVTSTPSGLPRVSVPALGGLCTTSWFDAESTPNSVVDAGLVADRAEFV